MSIEFLHTPSAPLEERALIGGADGRATDVAVRLGAWFGDERLRARVSSNGAVALVELRGEVGEDSAAALVSALDLARGVPSQTVGVVLRHVGWVDSEGFGALILAQKRLVEQGRRLLLCAPSEPVRDALRLTRLEVLLPVVRSVADLHGTT
ncbi:MAG TPA: STAS domain-containing protein [Chthonomonadales bacterium]|nr:STAS domain-containing protein [Chthonomonadales bacterium]